MYFILNCQQYETHIFLVITYSHSPNIDTFFRKFIDKYTYIYISETNSNIIGNSTITNVYPRLHWRSTSWILSNVKRHGIF